MPKMGDAMTEGILLSWSKENGAQVKAGDVIAEIETDKSNVEIEAEDAGVLSIFTQAGETVPVGHVIAAIGSSVTAPKKEAPVAVAAPAVPAPPTPAAAAPAAPAAKPVAIGQERIKATPLARRVARESGLDIARITGTGPFGRIVEADVQAHLKLQSDKPALAPAKSAPAAVTPPSEPIELTPIRRVIAKRMVESKTTIPHFYATSEIDMAAAVALREQLNSYDDSLPKISFNDMVVKAAAIALKKVPGANAAFKNDKIYPGNGVHVGIAVALDDGLIVPVVRDADKLPLRKIASTGKELIKKARDKKLQPQEYSGGTFTVSNLGAYDVENFIAIIDPAQGAILAVASIVKKPVVLADGITIGVGQRMNVTFSGDHRVMDGAVGAQFLQELKKALQNPLSLLEG